MLECNGMDLLPFPAYPHWQRPNDGNPKNERLRYLNIDDDTGWCLFSIEVRNTYGSPFDITLVRTQDGESTASSTTTIPPGSVSRWVLILLGKNDAYTRLVSIALLSPSRR